MRYSIFMFILLLAACGNQQVPTALGTLERDRIAHTATANEIVVARPVMQGAFIKKGTLLVQLDNTMQKAELVRAQAVLAQAQAAFEKLRNGARVEELASARANVAGARAALIESEANYLRIVNLRNKQLISQSELDKAKAARDTNQTHLRSSQEALLVLTNGAREEDLRIAEAVVVAANATLQIEQKRLDNLSVFATRDGILDSLPWNVGERVATGSVLAVVLAGDAPYASIYVPELYRVLLKVGDTLTVHVDGINKPIVGHLRWISNEAAFTPYYALNQEERSRLVYKAEVQLPPTESSLPNGLPVQVELP